MMRTRREIRPLDEVEAHRRGLRHVLVHVGVAVDVRAIASLRLLLLQHSEAVNPEIRYDSMIAPAPPMKPLSISLAGFPKILR